MTYERILPYAKEIVEPQRDLLRYVLRQPYSKEMVNSMLGLQKPSKKDPEGGWSRNPQYNTLAEELVRDWRECETQSRTRQKEKRPSSRSRPSWMP